jgi:DNA-binding HxlR family transcriptional regulator
MKKPQPSKLSDKAGKRASRRSICPVACSLDVLGDKWTLLVIRDLFMGKVRYSEFQTSPENIPTNILADRLKRLQQDGVISKQSYQLHPPRYQYLLTEKGRDLWPILKAVSQWGSQHIPDTLDAGEIMAKIEASEKVNALG